jgi:hypothetical protein
MNEQLVQETVDLFIETLPLQSMDADHPMFNELYEKECRIYVLLGMMTDDESNEYRIAVKYIRK